MAMAAKGALRLLSVSLEGRFALGKSTSSSEGTLLERSAPEAKRSFSDAPPQIEARSPQYAPATKNWKLGGSWEVEKLGTGEAMQAGEFVSS